VKNLNIFAITAGAAADMIGTLLTSIFISAVAGRMLLAQGVPEDEIGARMAADMRVLLWSVVLGLAASLVGGLVAARVAQRREVTHGAAAGAVGLVLATFSALVTPVVLPTWYVVVGYGLVVPVAALGGILGGAWNRRLAR
jgi:putative membrane protein (TIGR04086 family)